MRFDKTKVEGAKPMQDTEGAKSNIGVELSCCDGKGGGRECQ
jgi:hypothetical protein